MADSPRVLTGLTSECFQHPSDRKALERVRRVPVFGPVARWLSGSIFERQMRLQDLSSAVRLGPRQGAALYDRLVRAAEILDVAELPELYLTGSPVVQATTFGIRQFKITLTSALVDTLDEAGLDAILAHELGHIKCGHMLYQTMATMILAYGGEALNSYLPGIGALAIAPLRIALFNWSGVATLSCDRAALLATQNPAAVTRVLMRLAAGTTRYFDALSLEPLLEQAAEYHDPDLNLMEKWFRFSNTSAETHPFPVVRCQELIEWSQGGAYARILTGDFTAPEDVVPPAERLTTAAVGLQCPRCETLNPLEASHCGQCRHKLKRAARVCTECQTEVTPTDRWCPGCGAHLVEAAEAPPAELPTACAHCGTELRDGAVFCSQCGAPVTAPGEGAAAE